jgi:hypothetical protein
MSDHPLISLAAVEGPSRATVMPFDKAILPSASEGSSTGANVDASGRHRRLLLQGALEAVENQVEPEFEFVSVVVSGLKDMFLGELREVGYSSAGNWASIICAKSAMSVPVSDGRLASCSANP